MGDIQNLKNKRQSRLQKLREDHEKTTSQNRNSGERDERFWTITMKDGKGSALIRFLPEPPDESVPWVYYWHHSFTGPTGEWYIERSLTTIKKKDPVGEANRALWNTGTESDKEVVRSRKRRLTYVSNIYVIDDPSNPDNNGKVFLFRYGKKIFEKIADAMQPEFADSDGVDVFDAWHGANFRLRAKMVGGFRNYDSSSFDAPTPLFTREDGKPDDDKIEEVWKREYPLKPFVAEENYKSYAELEARLKAVIDPDPPAGDDVPHTTLSSRDGEDSAAPEPEPEAPPTNALDEEDFFAGLADG